MPERLLVIEPFAGHARGDRITDAKTMREAVASHPTHVLREPEPPKPKRKAPARRKAKPAAKAAAPASVTVPNVKG